MLSHPALDKLQNLRRSGMYQALMEQLHMPDISALSFEERHPAAQGQVAPGRVY